MLTLFYQQIYIQKYIQKLEKFWKKVAETAEISKTAPLTTAK